MAHPDPTFVLVPGAGGDPFQFHRVLDVLAGRGHDAIGAGFPAGDPSKGLADYVDAVVAAIGDRSPVVLVALSLGGFVAPAACGRADVRLLVLLNAMIPLPGETPHAWWEAVGWDAAHRLHAEREGRVLGDDFDHDAEFLHDIPADVKARFLAHGQLDQAPTPFAERAPFATWPAVPTRVLAGRDDRLFPLELQRRIARERLGVEADVIPGGHLLALSQPEALADALVRLWAEERPVS